MQLKCAKGLFGIEAAKTARDKKKKKKLQLNDGILTGMNVQNYKGSQSKF
jgi:hypothetical protein